MTPSQIEKNNPKITNAWCMYDWANSVFPLTITSAIFPIYWNSQTKEGIDLFGMHLTDTILFCYCLAFAFLIIALINPILGGIADSAGNKKSFMRFFVMVGVLSCFGMYFFDKAHIHIGMITFVLGTIGYAGSIVFYNAYLPEIATEDRYDKLSARGFSLGYIGGVVLLIINILLIQNPSWVFDINARTLAILDINDRIPPAAAELQARSEAVTELTRTAFVMVGAWWFLFSLIPLYFLPSKTGNTQGISLSKGYRELRKVFAEIRRSGLIKTYLTAFFFSSMGVQTVMYIAGSFADKELNMPDDKLIITILLIQLIAVVGAYLFSAISKKAGNMKTMLLLNLIWIGVCVSAYFVYSHNAFYALAIVVGSIMGGTQSLARSTFAKLIPHDSGDNTSYFSFYEFSEKVAIALGTFSFGFIEHMARLYNHGEVSMRYSVLALVVFFVIGVLFLYKVRNEKIED